MSFEWNRMHKTEDNILNEIDSLVEEYILDYYNVDCYCDLTEEHLKEIEEFIDSPANQHSILSSGFYTILNDDCD